jgi:hypothetical protein
MYKIKHYEKDTPVGDVQFMTDAWPQIPMRRRISPIAPRMRPSSPTFAARSNRNGSPDTNKRS